MNRFRQRLFSARWTLLLAGALLSGCAAQLAYREGESLKKEGHAVEALKKFEEALRHEPDSARYRLAVVNARAAVLGQGKVQATQSVNPAKEGAAPGPAPAPPLDEEATRHKGWIATAKTHLSKGDTSKAKKLLRNVLIENPNHAEASRLLEGIEQSEVDKQGSGQDALAAAFQKPITVEFKDSPLKSVFEVFSRSSGINFIFDREVKLDPKVTIFLRNTTIESAVKLVLKTNQLEYRLLDGNTVFVYPNTQAKLREYQPLTVRVFYLANAEAKAVASSLKTILKTRDLVTDDKLNMLILRDTPEAIRLAEKLVEAHDVAEPEVMLEVEILEVNRKRVQELGIRWPEQLSLTPLGAEADKLTLADLWSVARDRTGRTVGAAVGSTNINARVVDSDGEILANPRIRVRNRQKAKVLIGDRVPNITSTSSSTGFVAESISYVDVGLKLDVEPVVYVNEEVSINVALEVSTIVDQLKTPAGSVAYRIGTRSAQTVLRLKDGENQVLAGLLSNEERTSGNRVPGLGELPITNRLFGSQLDDANKTEIVLSITPRILRNVRKPGVRTLEFDSGTDGSIGGAGLSITSTPGSQPAAVGSGRSAEPAPSGSTGTSNRGAGPQTQSDQPGSPGTATGMPGSTGMRWLGPTEGRRGDAISVQLLMQSEDPVVSLPMSIGFDPKAVQILSVTEGNFLKQAGQSSFAQRVDPAGQILITSTSTSPAGALGPGVIATVHLRLLDTAPQETSLRVTSAAPVGLQGKHIDLAAPGPMTIRVGP